MSTGGFITIRGARANNLRSVDVDIPRRSLTVITGVSGSGKSSLAFDTLFAEGQRRYIETFSPYARTFLGPAARPDVDAIHGLTPVISIEQKTTNRNPRSTVGTITETYDYLRLLFARTATAYSPATGEPMVKYTQEQVLRQVLSRHDGAPIYILAPLVRGRKGHYRDLFETLARKGFINVRVDGQLLPLTPGMMLDRYRNHNVEVVVDKLVVNAKDEGRLRQSLDTAMQMGDGRVDVLEKGGQQPLHYSKRLVCPTTGVSYDDPSPATFSFNSPEGACPQCNGLGYTSLAASGAAEADGEEETPVVHTPCPACNGKRLRPQSLAFRIHGEDIADIADKELTALRTWLDTLRPPSDDEGKGASTATQIATPILAELTKRLDFLIDIGLDYLTLSRPAASLSGGESQRIRLATQLGAGLVNVTYILDEPSIGLHPRDNNRLIHALKALRDMGNTVIVVEHDRDMMLAADYLIDIGPGAGEQGGEILFCGAPAELLTPPKPGAQGVDSLTARWLRGEEALSSGSPKCGEEGDTARTLTITGCTGNNLRDVEAHFPLGQLICVCGVSGSGKSTLVCQTLLPLLAQRLYHALTPPLPFRSIAGLEYIDKAVSVDQSPIGRTPRSNPATYTGLFTDIRNLFAQMPEALIRGYKPGRFSFNVKGGRCEECAGNGYKSIAMNFLPTVQAPCPICHGARFNRATLEVRFRGKSIADVLNMTVEQAVAFFANQPQLLPKLNTLLDVGLHYLRLGQPSNTLSGGESQRIKLAAELSKRDTGRTLYVLDEPTTGLHFADIRALLNVLRRLVERGNTVIIIEHNIELIAQADYLIELGPEGGKRGGCIIDAGTPEELARRCVGPTGQALRGAEGRH